MGRHSSSSQWAFIRSVLAWAVPWILAVVVVGVAIWTAVKFVGGSEDVIVPQSAVTSSPTPRPSPTRDATPVPVETEEEEPEEEEPEREEPAVDFTGTTAQVLNGTGGAAGAAERMADRLARLGFEVVAIDNALGNFDRTVVYWTNDGARPKAEALAQENGWVVKEKPANLSPTVDIHVIVGLDEVD